MYQNKVKFNKKKLFELKNFFSSLDSIDEDTEVPWYSLIQNLSHDQLLILEGKFKQKHPTDDTNSEKQEGLSKEQFLDVVCEIYSKITKFLR